MTGLICLSHDIPCLVLHSLELPPQAATSARTNAACRLAVKVAEMLCRRW
ncbi:hypothetical protein [Bradyrhizobium sp. USDA 4353]